MKAPWIKLFLLLLITLPTIVSAQNLQISGTVLDSANKSSVVGAYIAVGKNTARC